MHDASEWQGFIKASWAPLARVMSKRRSRQGRVAPQGHTAVWQQRGCTQSRRPPPRVGVFRLKGCLWLHLSNGRRGGGFRCCRQRVSLEEAGARGGNNKPSHLQPWPRARRLRRPASALILLSGG